MNVEDKLLRIEIGFDQMRLEPPLKEVSDSLMAVIIPDGIGRLEPTHRSCQVAPWCPNDQMVMIGHQAIDVYNNAEPLGHLPQGLQKQSPVFVRTKDPPPLVASGGDMINGPFKFYSDGSCHGNGG